MYRTWLPVFLLPALCAGYSLAPAVLTVSAQTRPGLLDEALGNDRPRINARSREWHVAVNGRRDALGSAAAPWDLTTAFSGGPTGREVRPGDVIYLHGGTYFARPRMSRLMGTAAARIRVTNAPGERAIIDGFIPNTAERGVIYIPMGGAAYLDLYSQDDGLFLQCSSSDRYSEQPGSNPPPTQVGGRKFCKGVWVEGQSIRLIGIWIRDTGDGVSAFTRCNGLEVYGCIRTNLGWAAADRGHGHGSYQQNTAEADRRYMTKNVSIGCFSTGDKQYADSSPVDGFTWQENIWACNQVWYQTYTGKFEDSDAQFLVRCNDLPIQDSQVVGNFGLAHPAADFRIKGPIMEFGFGTQRNQHGRCVGNYFLGTARAAAVRSWDRLEWKHNTLWGAAGPAAYTGSGDYVLELTRLMEQPLTPGSMDWNRYFSSGRNASRFRHYEERALKFGGAWPGWQNSTGLERNSLYQQGAPQFTESLVVPVSHPEYPTPGRAHVVVMNFRAEAAVTVSLRHQVQTSEQADRGARELRVSPLTGSIGAGESLAFGAVQAVVERPAHPGDTTLSIQPLAQSLPARATAIFDIGLRDGQQFQVIDLIHPWDTEVDRARPDRFVYRNELNPVAVHTFRADRPTLTLEMRTEAAGGPLANWLTNPGGMYTKSGGTEELRVPHPAPTYGVFLIRPLPATPARTPTAAPHN